MESSFRTWVALAIILASAVLVFALTRDLQSTLVLSVGGVAAIVALATAPREPRVVPPPPLPLEPEIPIGSALDAIVEPIMLVRSGRVEHANAAARTLLGTHIVGEDARTAIRHPAAAEYLAAPVPSVPAQPIELVGLGTLDQRWEMRVAGISADLRLVHLIDRTGSYAAERMRVDFVANASHELRTPLASILGYVETLQDAAGEDSEVRARFLRIVFDEARRMERLVEDLMSLSRIEAEKFRMPAATVDLAELLEEVQEALADGHDPRGRDIVLTASGDVPVVTGDRAQLSQLFHNLIGNAMKYGRAETPIRVDLSPGAAGTICLSVVDQGEGIAPEHLPRLTERFYRVDPGRSRSLGGTGLGLAIVKHIVERHRGRLDIASTPGEGTRVTVTLRHTVAAPANPPATLSAVIKV